MKALQPLVEAFPALAGFTGFAPAGRGSSLLHEEPSRASPCPTAEAETSTGAHHKTSDLVGAGKEARRVGVHLLVLQPRGRAVGGLPAQGLPEAVCEGRPQQLAT